MSCGCAARRNVRGCERVRDGRERRDAAEKLWVVDIDCAMGARVEWGGRLGEGLGERRTVCIHSFTCGCAVVVNHPVTVSPARPVRFGVSVPISPSRTRDRHAHTHTHMIGVCKSHPTPMCVCVCVCYLVHPFPYPRSIRSPPPRSLLSLGPVKSSPPSSPRLSHLGPHVPIWPTFPPRSPTTHKHDTHTTTHTPSGSRDRTFARGARA